jgi:hypothetical protein
VFDSTGANFAIPLFRMSERKPPSWDEIRTVIEQIDEVCRESEYLREQAARAKQQPEFWPDRRNPGRTAGHRLPQGESRSTSEGSDGTL